VAKRKVFVFTGNRAEYGLLHPVIQRLCRESSLEVFLIISGSHLSNNFGKTIDEIDSSGVKKVWTIKADVIGSNKNAGLLLSFSTLIAQATKIFAQARPDVILVAGDRYETFAVATAAFYMNIPVAHLFGGDLSQGGHLDDSVRHSISKLAHLHFCTNKDSYQRLLKLGEEKWRIFNVGLTTLDHALNGSYAKSVQLAKEIKFDLNKPLIIFTQHPVTTESELADIQAKESLEALKQLGQQTIITYPCNDPGSEKIIKVIKRYARVPHFRVIKNLGWEKYIGFLKIGAIVVGNSSSGIMETPAFHRPCVNIGTRQKGRFRGPNVINVPYRKEPIKKAVQKALNDKNFIRQVKRMKNPYGAGGASLKIVNVLKKIPLNKELLQKKMTY
jgi:GDP/UDP-N,N'-diacetylbacillosamine 2-epimerase (hydrolysing)